MRASQLLWGDFGLLAAALQQPGYGALVAEKAAEDQLLKEATVDGSTEAFCCIWPSAAEDELQVKCGFLGSSDN